MNPSAFKSATGLAVAIVLVAETLVLLDLSTFLFYEVVAEEAASVVSDVGPALITLAATSWLRTQQYDISAANRLREARLLFGRFCRPPWVSLATKAPFLGPTSQVAFLCQRS